MIKVNKNRLYKKLVIIIGLILIANSLYISTNKVSAYTGGLLEGKPVYRSSDHLIKAETTTVLTDNLHSTSTTLTRNGGGPNYIFYNFDVPVTITDYQLYSNARLDLKFYDKNNNLILMIPDVVRTGTKTTITAVNDVYKVALSNPTSYGLTVYEFDVFGKKEPQSNTNLTFGLESGTYELTAPSIVNFGQYTISGKTQSIKKSLGTIKVGDLTGSGQGWRLQAQASTYNNGINTLPNSILQLKAPLSILKLDESTSNLPTISTGYPWFLDAGSDITILSAYSNEGMGSYSVDFTNLDALTFTIPSTAKPGIYSNTITWKIVVGP